MPEMYFKIKASLDAQLKVVITALKTLERMH
jgi:hypothetical protein